MNQKKVSRTYLRRFAVAMGSYVILLVVVVALVNYLPESRWNVLLSLLPTLPLIYGMWGYGRFLEGIDELQQLIHAKAIVLAAGLLGIGTFAYGMLQSFAGFPTINLIWIFPTLIVVWGFGVAYYGRPYNE